MIATNTGLCVCTVCDITFQMYTTSIYSDRSDTPEIGDVIYCPNCNQQYVYIGDETGENVFKMPNRFITKTI